MNMTHQESHAQFLAVYDAFVNEIFMFFISKKLPRDRAKSLTQETFMQTWHELSLGKTKGDLRSIHIALQKNADSLMRSGQGKVSFRSVLSFLKVHRYQMVLQ